MQKQKVKLIITQLNNEVLCTVLVSRFAAYQTFFLNTTSQISLRHNVCDYKTSNFNLKIQITPYF